MTISKARPCSLIITTKNEGTTISALLDSILKQTVHPHEIIIADAGSSDTTVQQIKSYSKKLPITLLTLPESANRSVGRNAAIRVASHDIILITDAGCVLDSGWVREMCRPFSDKDTDVVAGFYTGVARNVFELCQIPYVLVMPDRYRKETFLPATRSMGIRKSVWDAMGGFNERYRYAEDYIFARTLRERKYKIVATPSAIVLWKPRRTLVSFFTMIQEHAQGDAYNGAPRGKVVLIFIRYGLFVALAVLGMWTQLAWAVLAVMLALYAVYSIQKNYRYIHHPLAGIYLPLLQFTSDVAVLRGTIKGLALRLKEK